MIAQFLPMDGVTLELLENGRNIVNILPFCVKKMTPMKSIFRAASQRQLFTPAVVNRRSENARKTCRNCRFSEKKCRKYTTFRAISRHHLGIPQKSGLPLWKHSEK